MPGHGSLSALLSTPTAGWCNIYKVQLIPQPSSEISIHTSELQQQSRLNNRLRSSLVA